MTHAATLHLADQLLVTAAQVVELEEAAFEEALDRASPRQRADAHVYLDVFTEQVPVAHSARIHHPHAHGGI